MRTSTLVLGVIAAGAAAASIYLGVQLNEAYDDLAHEGAERALATARIRELEAERSSLQAALADAGVAAPDPVPANATPPVVASNQKNAASPTTDGSPSPPAKSNREDRPGTPAEQNVRRINQEVRLRRRYNGMPEELGLDAAQADKLFDLLANYQASSANDDRAYQYDPLGRQALEDATRAQRDADIEALLGPDKAAEFQSFEKSIPARMQVGRIGENMAAANVPLSDTQRKSLISAVVAEQDAGPPPKRPENNGYDAEYEMKFLDWQADYSKRVQARIEPLLTSEQVARYRDAIEVQNSRRSDARARAERNRNRNGGGQ